MRLARWPVEVVVGVPTGVQHGNGDQCNDSCHESVGDSPRAAHDSASSAIPLDALPGWYQPRPLMIYLLCCTSWDRTNRSDFTKLSSLSQTGRSTSATVAVNALVADMTTQNADPGQRKALSFTDNRQDAALQAGHPNDFVQVAQVRAAIVAAIEQRDGLAYAELGPALFEALGLRTYRRTGSRRHAGIRPGRLRTGRATGAPGP